MKARMLRGDLYVAADPVIRSDLARGQALSEAYNATREDQRAERDRLLRELLGSVGEGVVIRPPFHCDYGSQIGIGAGTFVNFGCTMLDVVAIAIGERCQIASGVQLLTATHPIDPAARRAAWEYGEPIAIGDNVWIGAGAIVCPGVTIGADSVIGAGAIVTRDIPPAVIAAGNPARVLREIGDRDRVELPEV